MNEYEIALAVVVRQRGADLSDAIDRAIFNLRLRQGYELMCPEPSNCAAEAGPATVVRDPYVIMGRATR
jgi:hypothetical protein